MSNPVAPYLNDMHQNGNKLIYYVNWIKLWRSISIYTVSALIISITLFELIQFIKNGFSFSQSFQHVTPVNMLMFVIGLCFCLIIFSLIISILFKFAAITIDEKYITGRNYWGFKKQLPLVDLISLYHYSNSGLNAIVAESKSHGKVYISEYTENLEDLLLILDKYLPADEYNA